MADPFQGGQIPAPPQMVSSVPPPPQMMPMPAAPPIMPPTLAAGPPPAIPTQCRVPGPPVMPPSLMQMPVRAPIIPPPAIPAGMPPPVVAAHMQPPPAMPNVVPPPVAPPVLAPPSMPAAMQPPPHMAPHPGVPPRIAPPPVGAPGLPPPVTGAAAHPPLMPGFPTMPGRMPPPPQAWPQKPPPTSANGEHKPSEAVQNSAPTQPPKLANDNKAAGDNDKLEVAAENTNGKSAEEDEDRKKKPTELVLPKALEDVLAFKDQRAAEFHINTDDFSSTDVEMSNSASSSRTMHGGVISNEYADGEDSEEEAEMQANGTVAKNGKPSKAEKNKKKRLKKKMNRKLRQQQKNEKQEDKEVAEKEDGVADSGIATTEGEDDKEAVVENEQDKNDEPEKDEHKDKRNEKEKEKEKDRNKEKGKDKDKDKEKDKDRHRHSRDSRRETRSKDKKETSADKDKDKDKDKEASKEKSQAEDKNVENLDVTIEYVPEKITIADLAPMYRQFYRVFEIFKLENKPKPVEKDKKTEADKTNAEQKPSAKELDDDDDEMDEEAKEDKEKLSKRKLKKLTRLSVAELKQLVNRPDVVEMHDVTARDPKLLVQLKAYRNTVQVPRHWCFKRKYLQGKRGIEKPPFDLPAFIKKTGIMEMRESIAEKDDAKSLKSKMRERVRPKMGKIDIDYQKLHDAFFKWQTKPRMTIHGDLYYEGKEFETRLKEKKPGDLSEELRIALGMPVGPSAHKIPPPWLIAQQRYGPPPSYPSLKIPGLNAPIPESTSFGYHAGGWGKPPVDENGKPLYGDVFGITMIDVDNVIDEGDIEHNQWGELESESEESSSEEEEDGEDMTNQPDETGLVTPAEGLVTPSGLTSVPAGIETPENIELRKRKIEQEMEDNETPVLYQVLPEKRSDRVGASMMGSTHVYDISTVNKQTTLRAAATTADREGTVELALDPSELDLDNDAMAQRYEQQMREQQNHLQKEDLSDLLAEHVARQKSKRKRQQTDTTKTTKKYKEFKF